MNPLLLPEYLMEKLKKWIEKKALRKEDFWNIAAIAGLTIALGLFLSGAPYVITYFEEVKRYDTGLLYGYGIFFLPRAAGEILNQTSYEMIYVLISYLLSGVGVFVMVKGSKSISQKNTILLTGVILVAISLLLILGLDYLKMTTKLS
ncbi:MAG: hypothetical protein NZ873_02590 [Crenarchaeota archaeon]|nr:hypothetical protein [Thermoproteota archaeon]MDW8034244.1 hypothetical protein [Nitrososphaerota archaeon]